MVRSDPTGYQPPAVKPLAPPLREPRHSDVPLATVSCADGSSFELKFDVYQRPDQTEPGPCVVYLFGGGWSNGDYKQRTSQKAVYIRDLVELTDRGITVVSASYRLVKHAPFPACVDDVKALIRHLKAHGPEYLIDPDRIGVLGNSAGGHLAGLLALTPDVPELEGEIGDDLDQSSSVRAAVLYYAPTDLIAFSSPEVHGSVAGSEVDDIGLVVPEDPIGRIFGYDPEAHDGRAFAEHLASEDGRETAEMLRRYSPRTYVRKDAPPMLILHGGKDVLVPISQSENLYHALTEVGADATYLTYSNASHGPSLGPDVDAFAYDFLISRL